MTASATIENQLDNRQTPSFNGINSINIYRVKRGQAQCWVGNSNIKFYDIVSELK